MKTASARTEPKNKMSAHVASFKALDAEEGIAEMIVSVFNNRDYAKDRVLPGAFKKCLQRKAPSRIKGVWMHDWTIPVSKTLEIEELAPGDARLPDKLAKLGGLYVKGQFNLGTQRGKEAFSDLQFGTIDEFSFGYEVLQEKYNAKDQCNDLIEIDILEWSPVLIGCNPATALLGTKEKEQGRGEEKQVKSQYLGSYAEGEATISAIRSLSDRLFYYALYDALYYDADEGETAESQLEEMRGAFDEFRDLSLQIFAAIMNGTASESADDAGKSLKSLWFDPNALPPAEAAYSKQIETVLATVQDCITRGKSIAALRAKDGRTLSAQRIAQIEALIVHLAHLKTDSLPKPEEKEVNALRRRNLERNLTRRSA